MLNSHPHLRFRSGSHCGIRLGSLLVDIRDEERIKGVRGCRDRFGPEFLQPCRFGRLGPRERWSAAARARASDMWGAVGARRARIGGQAIGAGGDAFGDIGLGGSAQARRRRVLDDHEPDTPLEP